MIDLADVERNIGTLDAFDDDFLNSEQQSTKKTMLADRQVLSSPLAVGEKFSVAFFVSLRVRSERRLL